MNILQLSPRFAFPLLIQPMSLFTKIAVKLIGAYQLIISPLLGTGKCRYHPSCSHYGQQAIQKYGIAKGSWLTFKRILSCQPLCICGVDPIPRQFTNRKVKK